MLLVLTVITLFSYCICFSSPFQRHELFIDKHNNRYLLISKDRSTLKFEVELVVVYDFEICRVESSVYEYIGYLFRRSLLNNRK